MSAPSEVKHTKNEDTVKVVKGEDEDIPVIFSRAGGDAGRRFDIPPGLFPNDGNLEGGGLDGVVPATDFNVYQHKKTLAQGMMDVALFSANANQMRYVLENGRSNPYFFPSVILISLSILFQVAVGAGLIWNSTFNCNDEKEICKAVKINNYTVIGIFLITVINVFISGFGVVGVTPPQPVT